MDLFKMIVIEAREGFVLRLHGADFRIVKVHDYKRKSDGSDGKLLTWSRACRDCDEDAEFKTGTSYGRFHPVCLLCRQKIEAAEADRKLGEKAFREAPSNKIVWEALRLLLSTKQEQRHVI